MTTEPDAQIGPCNPKGCEGRTGLVEDGCGGTIMCRPGNDGCTRQTCDTLGATCGQPSDGCGGRLTCGGECNGPSSCEEDDSEPDAASDPNAMPTLNDSEENRAVLSDRTLHGGDAGDWYRAAVVDAWDGGAPDLHINLSTQGGRALITGYFRCTQGRTRIETCRGGNLVDDDVGVGCSGSSDQEIMMVADCPDSAVDENGTATFFVRRPANARECVTYDLTVWAE